MVDDISTIEGVDSGVTLEATSLSGLNSSCFKSRSGVGVMSLKTCHVTIGRDLMPSVPCRKADGIWSTWLQLQGKCPGAPRKEHKVSAVLVPLARWRSLRRLIDWEDTAVLLSQIVLPILLSFEPFSRESMG